MKTMRILQEYAMVASHNRFQDPQKKLAEDIDRLEKGFDHLERLVSNDKEHQETFQYDQLQKVKAGLDAARMILKQPPSKERAMKFWAAMDQAREGLNRSLLYLSQTLYPDDEYVQGIMYANRLSTISQRYGALYLYQILGHAKTLNAKKQLEFLHTFFPDTIERVQESSEDLSPMLQKKVQTELQAIERDLSFFYIMGKSSRRFIPTLLYQKSENIAKRAEEIGKLFIPSPL